MGIRLKGKAAAVVLVVALGAIGYRGATLGESDDPQLRRAIQGELLNRLGGRIGEDLSGITVDDINSETLGRLLGRANLAEIEVHSMKAAHPILSWASEEEVVVLVEFSLPEAERDKEYWLFDHSAASGWRYRRPANAISYYLSVI